MYGIRIEPTTPVGTVDRSARAISARSRRSARAEERAYWIAQEEDERAERQRSARAGPRPVLTLVSRRQSAPATPEA